MASASPKRTKTAEAAGGGQTPWGSPILEFLITRLPLAWIHLFDVQDLTHLAASFPPALRPVIEYKLFGSVARIVVVREESKHWIPIAMRAARHRHLRELHVRLDRFYSNNNPTFPSGGDWETLMKTLGDNKTPLRALTLSATRLTGTRASDHLCSLQHMASSLESLRLAMEHNNDDLSAAHLGHLALLGTFPKLTTAIFGLEKDHLFNDHQVLDDWVRRHPNLIHLRLRLPTDDRSLQAIVRACPRLEILVLAFDKDAILQRIQPTSVRELMVRCKRLEYVLLDFYGSSHVDQYDFPMWPWHDRTISDEMEHKLAWRLVNNNAAEVVWGRYVEHTLDDFDPYSPEHVERALDLVAALSCTRPLSNLSVDLDEAGNVPERIAQVIDRMTDSVATIQSFELMMYDTGLAHVEQFWDKQRCTRMVDRWPKLQEFKLTVFEMEPVEEEDAEHSWDWESDFIFRQQREEQQGCWQLTEHLKAHGHSSLEKHWRSVWPTTLVATAAAAGPVGN